jgi:hypothetical protein
MKEQIDDTILRFYCLVGLYVDHQFTGLEGCGCPGYYNQ